MASVAEFNCGDASLGRLEEMMETKEEALKTF